MIRTITFQVLLPPEYAESVFFFVPLSYSVEKVKKEALHSIEDFPEEYTSSFLLGVSLSEILYVEFVNFFSSHQKIEHMHKLGQPITVYLIPYVDSHKKRTFDKLDFQKKKGARCVSTMKPKLEIEFPEKEPVTEQEKNNEITQKESEETKEEQLQIPTRKRSRNKSLNDFRKIVVAEQQKKHSSSFDSKNNSTRKNTDLPQIQIETCTSSTKKVN